MRKILLLLSLASGLSLQAASITYDDGITNVADSSGPTWVFGSMMFREIISDYGGNTNGPSGASASSQTGFSIFDGPYDITQLRWEFEGLELYFEDDSVTSSPGVSSPGYEDYRYSDGPTNLRFYYDNTLWVEGYVTRFVTEVENNSDANATGSGTAVITETTVDGQDFFDEIMTLSDGTGNLSFVADSFFPVSPTDPGTFGSTGTIEVVPEPETAALIAGLSGLACLLWQRRKRG